MDVRVRNTILASWLVYMAVWMTECMQLWMVNIGIRNLRMIELYKWMNECDFPSESWIQPLRYIQTTLDITQQVKWTLLYAPLSTYPGSVNASVNNLQYLLNVKLLLKSRMAKFVALLLLQFKSHLLFSSTKFNRFDLLTPTWWNTCSLSNFVG